MPSRYRALSKSSAAHDNSTPPQKLSHNELERATVVLLYAGIALLGGRAVPRVR